MNKTKIVSGFVAVILLSVSLTACNSIKNTQPQNSSRGQPQNNGQQGNDKKDAEIHTPIPDGIQSSEKKDVGANQMGKMGDGISGIDVDNGKLIPDALTYTVNKATLFADIADAGIQQDAMNPYVKSSLLDENGKIKSSVKFLLVEVMVKNNRALPSRNITSFQLLHADSANESSDGSTEMDFFDISEPSYFSHPSGAKAGDNWDQYYDYSLPVGQSKNLKVGWYVDLDAYGSSNLYLAFNRSINDYEKFVKLDF